MPLFYNILQLISFKKSFETVDRIEFFFYTLQLYMITFNNWESDWIPLILIVFHSI